MQILDFGRNFVLKLSAHRGLQLL